MTTYVGVDQALRKIGLCVLDDGDVVHLHLIKTPRTMRGTERLVFLRDQLIDLLRPYQNSITHAALEAQSLGSLGDIDQLGHINGIAQLVLADLGVPEPLRVPPASLKKFVAGIPGASKQRMMTATFKTWGIQIDQDDLCDAHGLARFAQEVVEQKSNLRHQVEAVHRLTHPRKKTRIRAKNAAPISL
jgi:Holliday junction resolvasome RuvABC endonuclease subunit